MYFRCIVLSLVWLTASSAPVRAQIASTELLGDQANLMSGAVTASTRGGPSIWYNPARLAFAGGESFTFAVSGVGFAFRYYNVPKLIATSDASASAAGSEMLVLPRAITLVVRASDKLYWGVGLFTPARQDIAVQAGSALDSAGATAFNAVALHIRRNSLHTMGSLSWKLSERLQLGAGLAFVHYSYFRSSQLSSAQYDATTSAASAVLTQASQDHNAGYGMRAIVGVSLQLAERWSFGVSLSAPTWLFYTNVHQVETQSAGSDATGPTFSGTAQKTKGGSRDRPEAAVARFGLAYAVPSLLIELDAELSGGASSKDFNVDQPAIANIRGGALIGVLQNLRLGFGIYTDFEQRGKELSELGDSRSRGVGATCGVNFISRMPGRLVKKDDSKGTYSITVTTRYTHFKGKVLGLDVTEAGMIDATALKPTAASAHEVAAQVGLNAAW